MSDALDPQALREKVATIFARCNIGAGMTAAGQAGRQNELTEAVMDLVVSRLAAALIEARSERDAWARLTSSVQAERDAIEYDRDSVLAERDAARTENEGLREELNWPGSALVHAERERDAARAALARIIEICDEGGSTHWVRSAARAALSPKEPTDGRTHDA